MDTLETLAKAGSGLLMAVLAALAWVVRRQSSAAKAARRTESTNVAAFRWHYRVTGLAALRGWDQDPAWPPTPREMTAEYLAGEAGEDPASPITALAQAAQDLTKGSKG